MSAPAPATTEEDILLSAHFAVLLFGPDQIEHLEDNEFKPETIITTLLFWIGLKVATFESQLSKFERQGFRKRLKKRVKEAVSIWRANNSNMEVSVHKIARSLVLSLGIRFLILDFFVFPLEPTDWGK